MSIKARLKRLEKKIAAAEVSGVEIGVFAGEELWRTEERDGIIYAMPRFTDEEFERDCRAQQIALLAKCARMNDELGLIEEIDETPKLPGAGDALAPLKDGQKRANYIYTTDEKGREVEIEVATGIRRLVK